MCKQVLSDQTKQTEKLSLYIPSLSVIEMNVRTKFH